MFQNANHTKKDATRHAICYQVSSIVSTAIFYPMDLIKAREMSKTLSQGTSARKKMIVGSILDSLREIQRLKGFSSLYSGLYYALVASMMSSAAYMFSYRSFLDCCPQEKQSFICMYTVSVCSSIFSMVLTNPLWLLKTRAQIFSTLENTQNSGTISNLKHICSREGFFGMYKGAKPQFYSLMVHSAYIPLYEMLKYMTCPQDETPTLSKCLGSTVLTKIILSTVTNPFQILQVNLQGNRNRSPVCMYALATSISRRDGIVRGLFIRGLAPNLLFELPRSTARIILYEYLMT